MLFARVRAGMRFDKLNHDLSVSYPERGTDLVAEPREFARSRKLPVVTTHPNVLFDALVHSQDIHAHACRERARTAL